MSRIHWNLPGERRFETGVDRTVLYPRGGSGVAWNGVVGINEEAEGGEAEALYFDGVKYADLAANEDFKATLEAFSTPREFDQCEGIKTLVPGLSVGQQRRVPFDLCYRTLLGNDLLAQDYGYKLHLVYNITASPASRSHQTIGRDISASTRSWGLSTVPPPATTFKPTAHLVVDSTQIDPYLMADLETELYGRDAGSELAAKPAQMLSIAEILLILGNRITDTIEATI